MEKPMTYLAIDTDAIHLALDEAAIELQNRFAEEYGERYVLEDLQGALTRWLELSIEALVEDVVFHTIEGDRTYAFNRRAFEVQLQNLKPDLLEPVPQAA